MRFHAIIQVGKAGLRRETADTKNLQQEKERRKMKSTGIVRKVDELGRIVLPIEMRRTLDIAEKDALEIYVEGEDIILHKYQAACVFCDSVKEILPYKGRFVCPECIKKRQEIV